MSLHALEQSAAKLQQTIRDEIKKKKLLKRINFGNGVSNNLVLDAKSFVGWLRKIPAWSAEFTARAASERIDSRLSQGTRFLEAIVDDWNNEHESLLALIRSNDAKWRKAALTPTADAVSSLLSFAKSHNPNAQHGTATADKRSTRTPNGGPEQIRRRATTANKLCELDEFVLLALGELKAFDKDSRRTADRVANHLDPKNDRYYVKKPLAKLKKLKLADSHQGAKGGSWLTAKGKGRFDTLNAKR